MGSTPGHGSLAWLVPFVDKCPRLEQSATQHYGLCVTDVILTKTENFFVFYIISMTTFFFLVVFEFLLRPLQKFLLYVCMTARKTARSLDNVCHTRALLRQNSLTNRQCHNVP